LISAPTVTKPQETPPKDRWLTRNEVARLLWACRHPKRRHLRMFILIAVYTGTRSEAIAGLQFIPTTGAGWVDLEKGILHRRGKDEKQTKKRRNSTKLPSKLLRHLERHQRQGRRFVIEFEGNPVKKVRKAMSGAMLDAGIENASSHTLKHTAITWAMQGGMSKEGAASYFSTTIQTIEKTYWHHSPDYMNVEANIMDNLR
jgi:integrase